jgi:hypothetical protein
MEPLPLPSRDYLHECFEYDPVTGDLTWRRRPLRHFAKPGKPTWLAKRNQASWNQKYPGKLFGRINTDGARIGSINSVLYKAHRLIFKLETGIDPIEINHRDRDRANNRLDNLRNASQAQGNATASVRKHNKLGVKGVQQLPGGRYRAKMTINKKTIHLGVFATTEDAHRAYSVAAHESWGEFASGH